MGHRGVTGWWAEWAIAHPDFGRIEDAAGHPGRCVLLLSWPVTLLGQKDLFLKIFEQNLINWPTVALRGKKEILTGIVS